jgi:ABC-type nickel/cobalt efflux system permease component RcnA
MTLLVLAWGLVIADAAMAHPLGNFSINHYSGIHITRNTVEVRYILDMAEIPTFQEIQEASIVPKTGDPSLDSYLTRKAEVLRERLFLEINGGRVTLHPESKEVIFPPGSGGLPTMKIGISYKVKFDADATARHYQLNYRDGNFPGRAGWKEVVAVVEPGAKILDSSVPEIDRSSELSNYPTDLLNSPPQDLEARVSFTPLGVPAPLASVRASLPSSAKVELAKPKNHIQPRLPDIASVPAKTAIRRQTTQHETITPHDIDTGSPLTAETRSLQLQANRQPTPRNAFTELMATKQLGIGIILVAFAVAVGLGAFHALEPGHGKTLVAAYLVGSRGTMKHALLLGAIVTTAHTGGVYLLGAATLYASRYIMPERVYPWLGIASGIMIMGLGVILFLRRYRGRDEMVSHHHDHAHGHHHPHSGKHKHPHGYSRHHESREASLKELLTLGISGGIVPCPAALVVLLSAVSMDRIGLGLLLIFAFSAGLAAVLIAIGLLMVYARRFMSDFETNGNLITRWLPLASSTMITLFGLGMVVQAASSAGYFSM